MRRVGGAGVDVDVGVIVLVSRFLFAKIVGCFWKQRSVCASSCVTRPAVAMVAARARAGERRDGEEVQVSFNVAGQQRSTSPPLDAFSVRAPLEPPSAHRKLFSVVA